MNTTATKVLSALDKAVQNLDSEPFVIASTLAAIARQADFKLPPELGEQLARLDVEWQAAIDGMIRYNRSTAYRDFLTQQQHLATRATPTPENAWDADDFAEDYVQRLNGFKARQKSVSAEAWQIVKPQFAAFSQAIRDVADTLVETERATASRFAVQFQPSPTLRAVAAAASQILQRASQTGTGEKPSAMIGFIPQPPPEKKARKQ